jgi:hypothetical protein
MCSLNRVSKVLPVWPIYLISTNVYVDADFIEFINSFLSDCFLIVLMVWDCTQVFLSLTSLVITLFSNIHKIGPFCFRSLWCLIMAFLFNVIFVVDSGHYVLLFL